jgi:cytidyltransferase-like protein
MKKKLVIVSGYFNPLHKGHIEYFHFAKHHGERLLVIINNDNQRILKGSKAFMNEEERKLIINELKIVDDVVLSIDRDKSVIKSLELVHSKFSKEYDLIFANGGDQSAKAIPEIEICKKLSIELIDRMGDKIQSSSWLLNLNEDEN